MAITLNQLEQTVLELGVEVYRLKTDVSRMHDSNEKFVHMIRGLKAILDEKGIIEADDFEVAVDIAGAAAAANTIAENPIDQLKKGTH